MDNSSKNSNSEINQQEDKDSDVCSKIIFITILLMHISAGLIFLNQGIDSQKHNNNFYNTECKPIVDNQSNTNNVDKYVVEQIDTCKEIAFEEKRRHNMFIISMIMFPLFLLSFTGYYLKYKD